MRKLLILLVMSLLSAVSFATKVKNLYKTDVAVMSRETSEREQGLQRALQQVLIKVSGNKSVAQSAAVKNNLKNAGEMVQQYNYNETDDNLWLQVTFQPQAIQAILKQAGLGTWGNERPQLVAWVLVEDTLGERLVAADANPELVTKIRDQANLRGLPLSLPLLDIEDLNAVSIKDVSDLNVEAITKASKRYSDSGILVGKVEQISQARWQSNWVLLFKGERLSWQEEGDSFDTVAQLGIGDIADNLASRFAVLDDDQDLHNMVLRVGQINSIDQYNNVFKYLKELSGVRRIQVLQIDPRSVTFQLETNSSEQAITQAIALNSILVPTAAESVTAENGTLDYQYTL